jgi:hypothetical protein
MSLIFVVVLGVAGLVAVMIGFLKTLTREGREMAQTPGYEVRTLLDGAPVCDYLCCRRDAVEFDGSRWLCERHAGISRDEIKRLRK